MRGFGRWSWDAPISLKNQIITYSIFVLAVNMIVIGTIAYRISSATIHENVSDINTGIVKQTAENIDFVLRSIERETINAFEGADLHVYLRRAETGDNADRLRNGKEVTELLNRYLSVADDVEKVYLVSRSGRTLTNNTSSTGDLLDVARLESALRNSGETFVPTYTVVESFTVSRKMIGLGKGIFDSSGHYEGFLLVLLKESTLESFYPDASLKKMMLVDRDGTIVSSNDKSFIGMVWHASDRVEPGTDASRNIRGENYLVSSLDSAYTEWRMYIATPYTNLFYEMINDRTGPFLITLIGLCGFVFLIVYFARRLMRPVVWLNASVKSINQPDVELPDIKHKLSRRWSRATGRLKFQTRLAFVLTASILMPVAIVIILSYYYTESVVEKKAIEVVALNAAQTGKRIDSYVNNLESSVYYFYYDREFIRILNNFANSGYTAAADEVRSLEAVVDNAMNRKKDILYIDIYNADMRSVFSSKTRNTASGYPLRDGGQAYDNGWFDTYRDYYNDELITFVRKVADVDSAAIQGYVFITIREADLAGNYRSAMREGNDTFVINGEGTIMSHDNKSSIGRRADSALLARIGEDPHDGAVMLSLDGGAYLLSYHTMGTTDWKIVNRASLQYIRDGMREILFYDLFVLVASAFVIGVFIVRFAGRISKPINELTHNVVHFANNLFDYTKEASKGDEIGQLTYNFHKMMTKIDILIKEVYEIKIKKNEAELKQKEAELATLQAQINPHFLYNTLEVIRWKSMFQMGGDNEVSDIVSTLSDYFRLSLSQGRRLIAVEEELEHSNSYMKIMNYRYRDKIDYRTDISDEALRCVIPKVTLQPILENALYHGIKLKEGRGVIRIGAWVEEGTLLLEVFDDGVGMEPGRLRKLREDLRLDGPGEAGHAGGYGLRNVRQRIEMHFGGVYGVEIDSEPGSHTTVRIRIPATKL